MNKFFSKAFEVFLTMSLYFGMGLLLLIAWQYVLGISIYFGFVDAMPAQTTWHEFMMLVSLFSLFMILVTWMLDIGFSFRGKYIEPPRPCDLEPQATFQYAGYAPGEVPENLKRNSDANELEHTDQGIEQMIKDSGADVAPRVPYSLIESMMKRVKYVVVQQPSGTNSTMVHAYLDGSFYLATGDSHCDFKANFSAEIGLEVATKKATEAAKNKLWELEGYSLYSKLRSEKYMNDKIIKEAKLNFIRRVKATTDDSRMDKPYVTAIVCEDDTVVIGHGDDEIEAMKNARKKFDEHFDVSVKPTLNLHHPL